MSELAHSQHNEYFGLATSKKFCDKRHSKSPVFFWGSFVNRQFHTIKYFCIQCFEVEVCANLIDHQKKNNCNIKILGFRNERLPNFILELGKVFEGNPQKFLF